MPMSATTLSIANAAAPAAAARPRRSLLHALAALALLLFAAPLFAKDDPHAVITIVPAASPEAYGVQPTFYVRIYASSNADPIPTGTFSVAFLDDDAHYHYVCLNAPIDVNANAQVQSCTYAGGYRPPVYNYHYVVLYSGDSNYNGDDHTVWASADYSVIPASPAFSMSDIPPVFVGQYFNATGLSYSGSGYAPTGTISLVADGSGNDYCFSTLSGTTYTPCFSSQKMVNAGVFTLHLRYTGDTNHNPYDNANAGTLTVYPAPTTLNLTLGASAITLGQSVDVLASVNSNIDANARISGTVQVSDGEVSCTITLYTSSPGNNGGYCSLAPASAGTRQITAKFTNTPSDADYADSQASVALSVDGVKTDGVCGSDDGKTLGAAPTNLCSAGTPSAVGGSGPWTWTCAGSDGGKDASCSAQKATTPSATTTTLSLAPNPVAAGHAATATVAVSAEQPTAVPRSSSIAALATPAAASGTVTVNGGGASCVAALANGGGSCALTIAAAGTYAVTATYSGDATNAASSATATLDVTATATTPALASAPALDERLLALLTAMLAFAGAGFARARRRAR